MPVKPVPDGFHRVTPYLIVAGAARLIDFLKEAFGAVECFRQARPDGSVMHAQVKIGDSMVMLGEPHGPITPQPTYLYLYLENADATYAAFMDVADPQLACDLSYIDIALSITEAGVAGYDNERAAARKLGDNILRDAVGEVFLIWIPTHVGEWQNRD